MQLYKDADLYNTLSELAVIPKGKLDEAYKLCRDKNVPFDQVLIDGNLITDANLGKIIADLLSTPYVNLSQVAIDEKVLKIIPEVYARKKEVISFNKDTEGIHVAMKNPRDRETQEFIGKKVDAPVKFYFATAKDIEDALSLYQKDVRKAFDEIISETAQLARGSKKPDPSIIKIVDTTLAYAYQNKASDVHIESYEDKSLIRFRIDGILHDIVELPIEIHPQIVTRIKVLAKLRTDEHQSAQDGKIGYKVGNEDSDIRVSIVPVTNGEKVVMRLLSERSRQFSLQDLGLGSDDLKKVNEAYKKPHGMILATGPTGSGKTTTLYALLKLLNKRAVNIMTIEDPVEYEIEGINQIQVNPKTNLTFVSGLRSIVRQDPNIILVGEIRDEETADIAINAAMTGHLVLSTLHTNDAATAIPRLFDFKIEPFLVGSTLVVIIAQRLVRMICEKCRYSEEIDFNQKYVSGDEENGGSESGGLSKELIKKYFGNRGKIRVYKGKGCAVCHQTGYVGRIGIFEVMEVDDEIRRAINEKKDASEIKAIAVKEGMRTMFEEGIEKVKQGTTTLEEVLRVSKE